MTKLYLAIKAQIRQTILEEKIQNISVSPSLPEPFKAKQPVINYYQLRIIILRVTYFANICRMLSCFPSGDLNFPPIFAFLEIVPVEERNK